MELPQQCSKSKVHLTLHPLSASSLPRRAIGFQKLPCGVSYLAYPPQSHQSTDVEDPPRVGPALGETIHRPSLLSSAGPGQCLSDFSLATGISPMQERNTKKHCYLLSKVIYDR